MFTTERFKRIISNLYNIIFIILEAALAVQLHGNQLIRVSLDRARTFSEQTRCGFREIQLTRRKIMQLYSVYTNSAFELYRTLIVIKLLREKRINKHAIPTAFGCENSRGKERV